MKRKSREFRPGATALEPRALLSGMSTTSAEITALARTAAISGKFSGKYIAGQDNRVADAPLQLNLSGAGRVQGLNRVSLNGQLQLGGFRPANQPDIGGTITLSSARGSVTLQVSGTGGNGQIAGHRFTLNASIVSGTGAFANVRGTGTVQAIFGGNSRQTDSGPTSGPLTLSLSLRPTIR